MHFNPALWSQIVFGLILIGGLYLFVTEKLRIDITAIPGAAKAQTSRVGLGAMPSADDDAYKRRTALLDTSKIPLGTAPAVQPRTIRIGARPTVRVAASGAAATFSPGRAEEEAPAEAAATSGRPTIKLKRPGGAAISVSAAASSAGSHRRWRPRAGTASLSTCRATTTSFASPPRTRTAGRASSWATSSKVRSRSRTSSSASQPHRFFSFRRRSGGLVSPPARIGPAADTHADERTTMSQEQIQPRRRQEEQIEEMPQVAPAAVEFDVDALLGR